MTFTIQRACLMLATLVFAGCAAKPIALSKQAQDKIQSTDVVLAIPQSNLVVTVPTAHNGQGGLIGAIVQSVIEAKMRANAEEAAKPILEAVVDYDFRKTLKESVDKELKNAVSVKPNLPVKVDPIATLTERTIHFDKSTSTAVLFCDVSYRLESGAIMATMTASLFPKAKDLNQFRFNPSETAALDPGNVIYRKTFVAAMQAVTPQNVRSLLDQAASTLAQQLANDIGSGI